MEKDGLDYRVARLGNQAKRKAFVVGQKGIIVGL